MTAKEDLFKVMGRIDQLKNTPLELTVSEELELRNLEVKKNDFIFKMERLKQTRLWHT